MKKQIKIDKALKRKVSPSVRIKVLEAELKDVHADNNRLFEENADLRVQLDDAKLGDRISTTMAWVFLIIAFLECAYIVVNKNF